MGTKNFANYAKSLWLFKVCVQLVVYGVCIFESITPRSPHPPPLLPLHAPCRILSNLVRNISTTHIPHPLWS